MTWLAMATLAGTENIYNGCWTNAPADASYDRARSLAL